MARLFIAIDLPERIRDDIAATYAAIPGARWVDEHQIHLTLRFIGDVDNPTMERIVKALSLISNAPFTLSLKGVGIFPPRKEPRVLWIGIAENQELMRLQGKIERVLTSIDIKPEDRKFHPHITVARLTSSPPERIARYITDNSLFSTESFAVSEFVLYQSFLHREGAHHVVEATYPLRGE